MTEVRGTFYRTGVQGEEQGHPFLALRLWWVGDCEPCLPSGMTFLCVFRLNYLK